MGQVVTVLEGSVATERAADLLAEFAISAAGPFPAGLMRSLLLRDANDPTRWRIETTWQSGEALAAMRSAGKPRGVQMFEAVGAHPTLSIFETLADLAPPPAVDNASSPSASS